MNSYPQKIHIDRPRNVSHGRSPVSRLLGISVFLALMAVLSWAAQAADWEVSSSTLQSESCPNGYFDPGETNTVQFVIKNISGGERTEVQVELLADGADLGGGNVIEGSNVDFVLSGTTDKATIAKDATVTATLTFRTKGTCGRGNVVNPKLLITAKDRTAETVTFSGDKVAHSGQLGATVSSTYAFSNSGSVTINDLGNGDRPGIATPYPSTVSVSNVPDNVTDATGERVVSVAVTLKNVTHPTQTELGALLVGPRGQKVVLFRGAGNPVGGFANSTFTISGSSGTPAPLVAPITDGSTYGAADYSPGQAFLGSAPGLPYGSLGDFKSLPGGDVNPNGTWSLYIVDLNNNGGGVSGAVAGGWTLTLTTEKVVCCADGATVPSITQFRDSRPRPSIAEVTVDEDTIFNSDDNPDNKPRSPVVYLNATDLQTSVDNLQVSAISADETKIKSSNVKISGVTRKDTSKGNNGPVTADRSLEFKPEPNANGNVQITLVATDGNGQSSSVSFNLKINSINDRPSFPNPVRNQSMNIGQTTPPLPFTVSDVETSADALVLTVASSDENIVPASNVIFTGSGTSRTLTVIPRTPTTSGRATITITARDANGGEGTMTFSIDFSTPAGFPTISPFDNVTSKENEAKSIGFTVRSGSSTPVDSLTFQVSSGNPTLLPPGNVSITGTGTDRVLTYTPVANRNVVNAGTAQITVQVSDGGKTSQTSFIVTVSPVNTKPSPTQVASQTVPEDSETPAVPFNVFDQETFNGDLVVAGRSSNQGIVPSPSRTINGKDYGIFITKPDPINHPETRAVKVVPLPNAYGRVTIFLDVSEPAAVETVGPDTTTTSFTLEVQPVNDAPSIGKVGNAVLAGNSTDVPATPADILNEEPGVPPIYTDTANIPTHSITLGVLTPDATHQGIYPGVAPTDDPTLNPLNEVEQTVSISASVDGSGIISSVFFDPGDDSKVKYSKTSTTLKYKLVPNKYGDAVITLTLTDNGTGGLGGDNLTTVRKFKIQVNPINDLPSITATPPAAPNGLPHGQAIIVPITLKDIETAPGNMTINVTSTDTATVPLNNIIAQPGQGIISIIPVTPGDLSDKTVQFTITATDRGAKDDGANPATTVPSAGSGTVFSLTFKNLPVNHPPVIAGLNPSAATIREDGIANATISITDPDGASDVNGASISATSSNPSLIPASGVLVGGGGATRSIAFFPNRYANGSATITIVATDPGGFSSLGQKFELTVTSVENAPTITVTRSTGDNTPWKDTGVPGRIEANEDSANLTDVKRNSGLPEVVVFDPETPADQLVVTAKSDNQTLIPDGNISVSSSTILGSVSGLSDQFKNGTKSLTIKPVANRSGDANITVQVQDGANNKVTDTFLVRILPVNDSPTINNPVSGGSVTVAKNAGAQTISLTGITAGPEEAGQGLTLKAVAINKGSNPDDHKNDLIQSPSNNDVISAVFSSTGTTTATAGADPLTGTLTFQPKPNVFGTATIIVTVSDNAGTDRGGSDRTSVQFDVVIGDANTPPTITIPTQFQNISIIPGQNSGVVPITLGDAVNETPANQLKLSFSSSNTGLIPNVPSSFQETGSGQNRGVIITPIANSFGNADVTVTVTDTGKADGSDVRSTSQLIKVTVAPGSKPTISPIADISTSVNTDTPIVNFVVNDGQTPASQLQVSGTSDDQTRVPNGNIQFGGTGSNRAFIIRPAKDQSGPVNITIKVTDADGNFETTTFKLNILGQPPTISAVSDQVIPAGGSTGALAFQINDQETFPGLLSVTATSNNQTFIPDSNIFLGGAGTSRTVTVIAAAGQGGQATITLVVTDGAGQTATNKFVVRTTAPVTNTPPTITAISDKKTDVGTQIPLINFTVGDDLTPAGQLKVTASASNKTLIPDAGGIFLGGSGAARTMLITPAAGKDGTSLVIVTVTDADGVSTSTSFTVTVNKVTPPPTKVANDFNGDGVADIIFQDDNGFLGAWFMSGDDQLSASYLTPNNVGDTAWRIVDSGDFNGDGKPDLLFQHTDGSLAVWVLTNGVTLASAQFVSPSNSGNPGWKAVAVADFDKDGKADILFQGANGDVGIWYLDGVTVKSVVMLKPSNPGSADWKAVAAGDFNNDGNVDVIFQHTDGTLGVWYLIGGNNVLLTAFLNPAGTGDAKWRVVGTTDLNGDGKPDLLLQNSVTTEIGIWYMNGPNLILGKLLNPSIPGGSWKIVAP